MITGAFGIKAETKKSDVGKYFTDVEKTMISHEEILNENSIFLNGESGKLKENVESNEISFTMDSDLRPKSDLQIISGSNDISYTEEI